MFLCDDLVFLEVCLLESSAFNWLIKRLLTQTTLFTSSTSASSTSAFPTSASPSTARTTSLQMSPSLYSTTFSPRTIIRDADRQSAQFLLFLMKFVPKFLFSLHIVFSALINCLVLLPFMVLIFYCWLRSKGKQGNRNLRGEPATVPPRQLLGPLRAIPDL